MSATHSHIFPAVTSAAPESRFLSQADCQAVMDRLSRLVRGGGYLGIYLESASTGNVRWARNQVSTSGDVATVNLRLVRDVRGAGFARTIALWGNDLSDSGLQDLVRRAEAEMLFSHEQPSPEPLGGGAMLSQLPLDPASSPNIFSPATDQLDADHRAAAAQALAQSAVDAGMLSAGYVQVSSHSRAVLDNAGHSRYFQWTAAQYSVTVRTPTGNGSGWAGRDHNDWTQLDAPALSSIALEKCLASRDPVRVEPGRYTTILEPQAVCDLMADMVTYDLGQRNFAEMSGPFYEYRDSRSRGHAKLGKQVVDARLRLSTDPMDPDLCYPPWIGGGDITSDAFGLGDAYYNYPDNFLGLVNRPITWIDRGILTALSYSREYAVKAMRRATGEGGSSAFRLSAPGTPAVSIAEMIATTKRGLLVTRFDPVETVDPGSRLCRGYTRDGLWFIENGKISKPAKNMLFLDSPLFALNKIEQIGTPTRVFRPARRWKTSDPVGPAGVIVPALKVSDFCFTALSDAV